MKRPKRRNAARCSIWCRAKTDDAKNNIKAVMDSTMIDYVISSVSETKIMDLFVHEAKRDGEQG